MKLIDQPLEDFVRSIYQGVPRPLRFNKSVTINPATWGQANNYWLSDTVDIIELIKITNPKSILDYGCGKSTVINNICKIYPDIDTCKYDPFIDEYSIYPTSKYDLILCNFVLQMLHDELLTNVISELYRLTNEHLFVCFPLYKEQQETRSVDKWIARFSYAFDVKYKFIRQPNVEHLGQDLLSMWLTVKQ
jgi:trans-aconitate methyltransferase